ncbi:MAG: signal peptidase I [Patescibacteria group bacterium]
MKVLKFVGNIIYGVVVAILLFAVVSSFLSFVKNPLGLSVYVVQSGSMQPSIKVGSMVLVKSAKDYKKGDIITFYSNLDSSKMDNKFTTTHRVYNVNQSDNKSYYETKGDANNAPDPKKVPSNYVIGRVFFTIPLIGYLLAFMRTQLGFILFVVIPATLIVYNELLNIKNEAKKLLEERRGIRK